MPEFATDVLFLKGRVQVETALGALAHTGINPEAEQRLQTLLDVHMQLSDGSSQNDLSIYLQGETAKLEKADIVASLDELKASESAKPEKRIAAAALHEILQ